MADKISQKRRSENMRQIKSSDMKPEMAVRKLIYGMGFRYRLHKKDLPGKPDLVFGPRKKVIFVHGCFWHQHPDPKCLDGRKPKSNKGYWDNKLETNVRRDRQTKQKLENQGWKVLTIWECETKAPKKIEKRIKKFLSP